MRKLGTLNELLVEHGPTRDDVMKWAKEEARLETLKYKKEQQAKAVQLTFHSDHKLDYDQKVFYRGGYLFPQTFYYRLQLDKTCRKIRDKYKFQFDMNAILSDLVYARILEPASKRSSYKIVSEFLEQPSYKLHDVYRALDVLGNECDFIQSEVYKNSHLIGKGMTGFFTMIAQTTSLKSSRKMVTENMAKVRNIAQILSYRWACSWMATAFRSLFLSFQEMQMNRFL